MRVEGIYSDKQHGHIYMRFGEINYPHLAETTNLGPTHWWPMGRKQNQIEIRDSNDEILTYAVVHFLEGIRERPHCTATYKYLCLWLIKYVWNYYDVCQICCNAEHKRFISAPTKWRVKVEIHRRHDLIVLIMTNQNPQKKPIYANQLMCKSVPRVLNCISNWIQRWMYSRLGSLSIVS
jgi:hypothetical protein